MTAGTRSIRTHYLARRDRVAAQDVNVLARFHREHFGNGIIRLHERVNRFAHDPTERIFIVGQRDELVFSNFGSGSDTIRQLPPRSLPARINGRSHDTLGGGPTTADRCLRPSAALHGKTEGQAKKRTIISRPSEIVDVRAAAGQITAIREAFRTGVRLRSAGDQFVSSSNSITVGGTA